MVIALGDELAHLIERILPPVFHVHRDIRDLRPDDDAVLVAEVVEFLRVLIVGKTQGVRPQFPNDSHIGGMIFIGQRVALALYVLMTAYAPQRIAAPVEEKALFGIAGKHAAAEAGADLVSGGQLCRRSVEIGIFHAVPEMYIFDHELRRALDRLRLAVHRDIDGSGIVPGLHGDDRAIVLQIDDRRDLDAGRAVFLEFKVLFGHGDQVHTAIQPAVEGEVRLLRIDAVVVLVADGDFQEILFRQLSAELHAKGRITSFVTAELFPVQKDLAGVRRAVELQKHPLADGFCGVQLPTIPAGAAIIVVAAVLTVQSVPGVGKRDRFPCRFTGFSEIPVVI